MKRLALLFLVFTYSLYGSPTNKAAEEASNFGKASLKKGNDLNRSFSSTDIEFKGECDSFDPKKAKDSLIKGKEFKSSTKTYLNDSKVKANSLKNRSFDEEESFIKNSENLSSPSSKSKSFIVDQGVNYTLQRCQKPGDVYPVLIRRSLVANVEDQKEVKKSVKVCQGHRIDRKKSVVGWSMHKDQAPFEISTHKEDSAECNNYKEEWRVVRKGKKVVKDDTWNYSQKDLSHIKNDPNCTLFRHTCLDGPSERKINGKKISRKCWKEELSFLCTPSGKNTCSFLKAKNCELVKQKCLSETQGFCTKWKKEFKCRANGKSIDSPLEVPKIPFSMKQEEEPPNTSFAEVSAKLSILSELEHEIEGKDLDVKNIQYFSGQKFKCSKSLASNLIYDCCFTYKGFAKKAGLAKCSADEIQLSKLRNKNSCHYVGKYSDKTLGVKVKDHHSYCCFGSKLSKIIQVQGREQLGLDWGNVKSPNCRGLSYEEISKVDFSKLDLTELLEDFSQHTHSKFEDKKNDFRVSVKEIKSRLKERWKDVS
jgi:conjugal transfer mating pair stabilization protein TraN